MDGIVRYAQLSDERCPSASTIKLPIMLTAFRAYEEGTATPESRVTIHRWDLVGGSPYLADARVGETYPLGPVVEHMIRQSDNTAANALISYFGFARINAVAESAGMTRTILARHFLDTAAILRHSDNLTTAHDLGTILYQIERGAREAIPTVAQPVSCRRMIEILLGQEDRDKIPAGLPHGVPVANKTGEISGVRNDAAIVDPYGDTPYVIAVLTKGLYGEESEGIAAIARVSARVYAALSGLEP